MTSLKMNSCKGFIVSLKGEFFLGTSFSEYGLQNKNYTILKMFSTVFGNTGKLKKVKFVDQTFRA